jgi:hypothetical protein
VKKIKISFVMILACLIGGTVFAQQQTFQIDAGSHFSFIEQSGTSLDLDKVDLSLGFYKPLISWGFMLGFKAEYSPWIDPFSVNLRIAARLLVPFLNAPPYFLPYIGGDWGVSLPDMDGEWGFSLGLRTTLYKSKHGLELLPYIEYDILRKSLDIALSFRVGEVNNHSLVSLYKRPSAVPNRPIVLPEGSRGKVLDVGMKYLDVVYKSPSSSPPGSFDCSSFLQYCFRESVGIDAPSSSGDYLSLGESISEEDALPGDIIVFSSQPGGNRVDHVAFLLQKSPSGKLAGSYILHAASLPAKSSTIKGNPDTNGVKVTELGKRADGGDEYFLSRVMVIRRIIKEPNKPSKSKKSNTLKSDA